MSRTFRCRHLPAARAWDGVLVNRVTDGSRGFGWRRIQDLARAQVEAEFGPRPSPYLRMVHVRGLTHKKYHPAIYKNLQFMGAPLHLCVENSRTEVLPGRMMKTWEAWAWDEEVDRLVRNSAIAISPYHPLQRRGPTGGRKKFERVQANRRMRRMTHQTLAASDLTDDWDGHMPSRNTYFDWRSIY